LGEGDRKMGELLSSLERTQHELEKEIGQAKDLRREAEIHREQAQAAFLRAKAEGQKRMDEAREEARQGIQEAREELRHLIQEFKSRGRSDVHRLDQAIKGQEEKLQQILVLGGEDPGNMDSFSDPRGPLKCSVNFSSMRKLSPRSRDKKTEERETIPGAPSVQYEVPTPARELKIIGLRVEEAIPLVDKAIDEAFLGGLRELEVIHGAGTGRLRKAVRDHLRAHMLVKTFLPGGTGRGGDGVTVVEIGSSAVPARQKMKRTVMQ
jgi:DNA mismatch repair protein MutS2